MDGKQLQVLETKEMLKQGLLTLLQSQDFSEISVTDIIEVSQTSRRTFYRHFRNKRALLDYYLQELMKEYFRVEEDTLNKPNQYEAYLYLFRFWYSKRQELRGLVKSQLFSSFISAWNAHSPAVLQSFFKEQMDMQLFRIHFLIGGYSNAIWNWLQEEEPERPEVITDYFFKIVGYFACDKDDSTSQTE